jgi:HlyD family secretion protein
MNLWPASRGVRLLSSAGAAALMLGIAGAPPFGTKDSAGAADIGTWRVERRAFDVALTEQIVFEADSVAAIASSLPSNFARVVSLAPEGSLVAPGDELARFDPTPFIDDLTRAQSELVEAQAQLERARTELEIKRADLDAGLDEARRRSAVAELSRKRLVEAEIPAQRRSAAQEIEASELELSAAEKTRNMTIELHDRGYASRDELDAAEDALAFARQRVASHRAAFDLLETVEFAAMLEEAELERAHLAQEIERQEADYPRQLQVASGAVTRFEARIRQLEETIAKATGFIEASTIEAPVAGIVSYPALKFGEEQRKAQVGDTIWQRQAFLVLPDLDSLVAHAQVREVDVGGLKAGQPVRLTPHAFPDLVLEGEVLSVGTVVDADRDAARRFEVRLSARNGDSRLRPGMTGRAEIHTHHYDHVAVVPLDAIHYLDGRPVAYVRDGQGWSAVAIKLGGSDGALAAVESGLSEGQTVALFKPPDTSS